MRVQLVISVLQGRKEAGKPQQIVWSPDALGRSEMLIIFITFLSSFGIPHVEALHAAGNVVSNQLAVLTLSNLELLIYPTPQLLGNEHFKF